MIEVDITMVWRIRSNGVARDFDNLLLALLGGLADTGKLTAAAKTAGITPRHGRNLINQWGETLGAPLVVMRQGLGTTLTPLGETVLWAGRRVQSRLAPELDGLASQLAHKLNEAAGRPPPCIVVHASHDFAVSLLREHLAAKHLVVDLQNRGSFDALASLRRGNCIVAGFHVAQGKLNRLMSRRYAEGMTGQDLRFLPLATRRQGLIVVRGNPKRITTVADFARPGIRIINRQRGSGTRALLEFLLGEEGVDRKAVVGYDTEEVTHSAVAALVAGQQADVGLGLEAAAARFNLGFVPLITERYLLAFDAGNLDRPDVQALRQTVASSRFRAAVNAIPGYRCLPCDALTIAEALGTELV
jgi:molybdate-binding protein/molybdenum-dependent DNA-binding transcriptional regulator ModE